MIYLGPRTARLKPLILVSLLALQECATETPTNASPSRTPTAENTPSGAVFSEAPEMSEIMNGVMAKLSRFELRESVKGARIDCMISIDGHSSDCMDITPPGPNVFSKALLHALEQPDVRFKPMTLNGSVVAGRHVFGIDVRASRIPDPGVPVKIESLPGYRAAAPTTEGNTPSGALFSGVSYVPSNRRFPFYPPELEEKQVEGAARAVCTIQTDGNLTDCHELDSTGSPAFGASLMTWLTTPGLLARPLLLNGTPVVGTHEFHMHFRLARGR